MNAESESNTRLRGRWFAWCMWTLTTCLAVFSIAFVFLNDFASFPDPFCCSGFPSILTQSMVLACSAVGVLIISHRSRNSIGWIFIFSGFGISLNFFALNYSIYTGITQPGSLPFGPLMAWLASWVWLPSWWSILTFSLLLFPDGKLPSQRWQPVVYTVLIVLAANIVVRMFKQGPLSWGMPTFENPFGIGGAFGDVLRWADGRVLMLLLISVLVSALSLLVRFIGATNTERQQIKWLAYAGSMAGFVLIVAIGFLYGNKILWNPWVETILFLPFLGIPISVGIAILKHHLFNIDLLINRTLVYFTLIAVIAGLYVLVVGSLSSLLQNQNDLAAPLVALLIVAALVTPLHRALQKGVNRLLRFDPGRRDESQVVLQKTSKPSNEAREENIQAYVVAKEDSSPYTRLQGRWLLSARLGWSAIAMLATIIYIAAAPIAFNVLRTPCYVEPCDTPFQTPSAAESATADQASREFGAWYHTGLEAALRLLTLGVALLIFWRRSDDWMALLASILLVTVFAVFSPSPMMLENAQPLWHWPLVLLRVIALAATVGMFYLFPDGRFVPRWTRSLAIALLVFIGALAVAGAPFQTGLPVFLAALTTGAGFQVYRYRRVSGPLQRQQTKWVVLGISAMVLPMLVFFLFAYFNPSLNPLRNNEPIFAQGAAVFTMMITLCVVVPLCFLPVTLAFSILRYRLWDVDILINRTLVYGTLTASVIGLYVLIVGWSSIGLQTQNNLADSVFAILVIAFLFRTLHQRLQRIADRFVPVPQTASSVEQHAHQIAILENQGAADTRSRGRWFTLMHAVWVLCAALASLIFLAALSPGYALYFSSGFRVAIDAPAWYVGAARFAQGSVSLFATLVSLVLAGVIFWRKRDDPGALFVSFYLLVYGILFGPLDNFADAPTQSRMLIPPDLLRDIQSGVSSILSLLLFYLFPNGRFVPRWTRYAIWPALLVAPTLASLFGSHRVSLKTPLEWSVLGIYTVLVGLGVYAQIYRYRRFATPVEKQQTKTVVFGFMLVLSMNILLAPSYAAISQMPLGVLRPWWAPLRTLAWWVSVTIIPVSLTIAIMRYRLWDIDIIINRTLVYGALTGIVVSAFVILVGLLSVLFQSSGNSIVAIVATGLIALLFNPLRQRLQRSINHLMYGERDQPYIALSRLGRQLETSLAPEAVLPTVVTTVRDVLKLPYVAIYSQQDSQGYKIVAESASPLLHMENGRIRVPGIEREGRCIPLIHQGETLGYIVLGPRAPNEAFSTTDLHLLEDLAPQVGVAVHAVRLTADLQRSRERLVVAREEERRRLRRDLHDGLGPQLAGLALKLETLRNRLHDDPLTDSLLADLAKRTQDATADIRHLVYELRPPTLDELGLVMALREGVTQFTQQGCNDLNITFDAPESLPALPAAVEVAAYRITQEALTNVVRHAEARNCHVQLRLDAAAGFLQVDVQDDGKGLLLKRRAGVGLNSMRERAEELGGSFAITPVPAGGTLLSVCLPCRADGRSTSESSQEDA